MTPKLVSAGIGVLAGAAAVLTIGSGVAAADTLKPQPSQPGEGPAVEGGVRAPGVQGELRAAGKSKVQAQGTVNGPNSRIVGQAVPPRNWGDNAAWAFPGALNDFSSCVVEGPFCRWWMAIPFDPNNPH